MELLPLMKLNWDLTVIKSFLPALFDHFKDEDELKKTYKISNSFFEVERLLLLLYPSGKEFQ